MKLLFVLPSFSRGGAEEVPLRLARYAAVKGVTVHALLTDSADNQMLARDLRAAGVQVHNADIQDEGPRKVRLNIVQLFNTVRMLRRIRPDVVQINVPYPRRAFGAILACAMLQMPTLALFHLIPKPIAFSALHRQLYAWARRRNQHWVAVSENNRRLLLESFRASDDEIFRITNGYTPPSGTLFASRKDRTALRRELLGELGLASDARLLLSVGRLTPQKGYDLTLQIVPEVLRRVPNAHFLWVGGGELSDELRRQAERLGVDRHIHMLGHRTDVDRLMETSDVFLFPTRFEGQPLALMEALAHGMPIVASRASGIPEVITSGTHGLLVPVEDTDALLQAVVWALENPDEMAAMGANAREHSGDFTEEEMMGRYYLAWVRLAGLQRPNER